ncbi:MAG: hypothetical protein WCH78_13145 [Bacteroidota bacterium]
MKAKQLQFLVSIFFCVAGSGFVQAQAPPPTPESQQFYYSAKGMSFVPSITKPGLIYQGHLYTGKSSLDYLIEKVNVPECYLAYDDYKRNRTWATILSFVGTATSIVGLIGTKEDRQVNWWLLGGGILINGGSAYFNAVAAAHLRDVAVILDQQNRRVGLINSPKQLGINIPLKF